MNPDGYKNIEQPIHSNTISIGVIGFSARSWKNPFMHILKVYDKAPQKPFFWLGHHHLPSVHESLAWRKSFVQSNDQCWSDDVCTDQDAKGSLTALRLGFEILDID